ncbi:MAG: radical SAM protein [Candidatus Omnitrophica bacterium]|nr:radical SAM protein [Candidatus Omnitrophota bacterium]
MFKFAKGALGTILFGWPLNARLWITRRCNYQCRMCSIFRNEKQKEMTLDELKTVAFNLKKLRLSQVILTGGEPFLRPDIIDIIKIFKPYGFIIRIQTNAAEHVTEDLLDRAYKAGLDDISVSLDTLDPLKQDAICAGKGVLKNAKRVLDYCSKHYADRGVIAANVVISRQNFFELPQIIEFCKEKGIFFDPCIFTRKFSQAPQEDEQRKNVDLSLSGLDSDKVKEIFGKIDFMVKNNYPVLTTARTLKSLYDFMLGSGYKWKCKAGLISFDVAPSGRLAACCDTIFSADQEPVADLSSKDFISQYRSREFQEKCLRQRQDCEGCLYGCYRDPVYLAGDLRTQWESLYKSIVFKKVFN